MRVITGSKRGKKLRTLDGIDVRPTTDMVKEAMFSSIQFEVEGSVFLDLFAGSGQLGIEALSRGANTAYFVDASKASLDVVRENLLNTGFQNDAKVIAMDARDFLKNTKATFDLAILDPPYNKGILEEVLPLFENKLSNGAKVLCEHESGLVLAESFGKLKFVKKHRYGKIEVSLYVYGEPEEI